MPMPHVLRYGNDYRECVPGRDDQRDRQDGGGGQRPREPQPRAAQRVGQRRPGEQRRRDDRRRDGGERERQQLTDGAQRRVLLGRAMIGHASPADVGCRVPPAGKGWMPACRSGQRVKPGHHPQPRDALILEQPLTRSDGRLVVDDRLKAPPQRLVALALQQHEVDELIQPAGQVAANDLLQALRGLRRELKLDRRAPLRGLDDIVRPAPPPPAAGVAHARGIATLAGRLRPAHLALGQNGAVGAHAQRSAARPRPRACRSRARGRSVRSAGCAARVARPSDEPPTT